MPEAIPPGRIDLLLEKLTRDRVGPKTKMQCKVCWYVYDPALGCEEMDVPPGTPFNELPAHFVCPDCGNPCIIHEKPHPKSDFFAHKSGTSRTILNGKSKLPALSSDFFAGSSVVSR